MTAYTNRLTDLARRNADERKARKESARTEARMTPLEDRLRKLLERIPREEQVEGLSIHGLQTLTQPPTARALLSAARSRPVDHHCHWRRHRRRRTRSHGRKPEQCPCR
jgi:hypothetical protein